MAETGQAALTVRLRGGPEDQVAAGEWLGDGAHTLTFGALERQRPAVSGTGPGRPGGSGWGHSPSLSEQGPLQFRSLITVATPS